MGGISNEKAQSTSKTWTWVATCHTRDRSPQQTVLKELNASFNSQTNRKKDLFSFSHVFPQHIPDMIQRICMIFMTKERLSDWSVAHGVLKISENGINCHHADTILISCSVWHDIFFFFSSPVLVLLHLPVDYFNVLLMISLPFLFFFSFSVPNGPHVFFERFYS